jgi:cytochrome c1
LSNVARRRSEADLRKQLIDPEAVARGSYMPSFASLPAEEMEALIAFLKIMDQTYEPAAEPRLQIPLDASGRPRFSPEQVDRGAQLFLAQCLGCHTVGRQGAPLGPNLTREALRGRTDAWQLQHLKDPLSVYVMGPTEGLPWLMPRFDHLSDEDLQALVAYIQSLH